MTKTAAHRLGEPITPPEDEVGEIAKIAAVIEEGMFKDLPPSLVRAIEACARQMGAGRGIAIIPYGRELTTQQAADLLGVSRPFLVSLVDRGEIPSYRVGTHRRIELEAVLRYRDRRSDRRRELLKELSTEGQRLGLADERSRV